MISVIGIPHLAWFRIGGWRGARQRARRTASRPDVPAPTLKAQGRRSFSRTSTAAGPWAGPGGVARRRGGPGPRRSPPSAPGRRRSSAPRRGRPVPVPLLQGDAELQQGQLVPGGQPGDQLGRRQRACRRPRPAPSSSSTARPSRPSHRRAACERASRGRSGIPAEEPGLRLGLGHRGEGQSLAPGADGGQQGPGVVGEEEEGGVGRPLLQQLEHGVLGAGVHGLGVFQDVDLAPGLVGADVGVGRGGPGSGPR